MGSIHLEIDSFDAATRLAEIFNDRMLPFTSKDDNASSGDSENQGRAHAYVCSSAFEAKSGGQEAIIALGRKFRASQVLVVSENQPEFMIEEKFGGKFIRISIPAKKAMLNDALADRALDYGLQLIATLLSGEKNVAAGDSSSFELLNLAKRVASTDVTVFVNGPTGTGKEVLAKFVHNHSSRTAAPFVGVNCAAIPENMLEAILFGYEKGAFTGASTSNKGIFRAADSGTLLLDEISEMPLGLQAKLLRVLQEKAVTPIGSQTDIPVDVRVIATTNRDMAHEIRTGGFREDLYYRLNVFPLNTISVADRALDIVPICTFLMRRHCNEISNIPWLTDGAVEKLTSYSWPGNVRELENVLQRALVLAMENKITAADIVTDDVIHNMNRQPLTSDSLQNVAVG
jgi:two-component system response regulator FlrC